MKLLKIWFTKWKIKQRRGKMERTDKKLSLLTNQTLQILIYFGIGMTISKTKAKETLVSPYFETKMDR